MTKHQKLIGRFLSMPYDFHFDEMVKLLANFGFYEVRAGKTSGSQTKFINKENVPIRFHRPHPNGIMKKYQLKQIKEILDL